MTTAIQLQIAQQLQADDELRLEKEKASRVKAHATKPVEAPKKGSDTSFAYAAIMVFVTQMNNNMNAIGAGADRLSFQADRQDQLNTVMMNLSNESNQLSSTDPSDMQPLLTRLQMKMSVANNQASMVGNALSYTAQTGISDPTSNNVILSKLGGGLVSLINHFAKA